MSYNVTANQMNQGIDFSLRYQLSFMQDGTVSADLNGRDSLH